MSRSFEYRPVLLRDRLLLGVFLRELAPGGGVTERLRLATPVLLRELFERLLLVSILRTIN